MNSSSRPSLRRVNLIPADLPARLRLPTGDATLRSLEPGDAGRLLQFFGTHTPETVHQRYGYTFSTMSAEQARRLVDIDRARDVALGLFEHPHGQPVLIAIGRYCLAPDGRSAEAAFVVHEERRCLGIGGLLLRTLVNFAAERGVPRLVALVQHDNAPMLSVFRRAGASIRPCPGAAELEVNLPVPPPAPASRSAPGRPRRPAPLDPPNRRAGRPGHRRTHPTPDEPAGDSPPR